MLHLLRMARITPSLHIVSGLITLASPFVFCQSVQGGVHTWVDGRFYVNALDTALDGGEFVTPIKKLYGDMVVNYYHDNLPFGSHIEIVYGLGGTEQSRDGNPLPISWLNGGSVEAQPIGPYVWSAHITSSLAQYEGQRNYLKLEFCVRVTLPSNVIYDPPQCQPHYRYLEARIPWDSVPPVVREEAHWRRLPHAIKNQGG